MIADLHAHYPIHLTPAEDQSTLDLIISAQGRGRLRDRIRARLVHLASIFGNYENGPVVTVPQLQQGGVQVCLSVLYSPFDEMDLELRYGSEPRDSYMQSVRSQLADVEADIVDDWGQEAAIARNPSELDTTLNAGKVALVHCIEGGFHLGDEPEQVEQAVTELAGRGVAYITIAHLFWRSVATNAPALPFLSDRLYRLIFPQPRVGLSELGRAAIRAMIRERMLIDVSHMSELALAETFDLLDELDPNRDVPVVATHVGYRFGRQEYNLSEQTVRRIVERDGVIGLILSDHIATDGLRWRRTRTLGDSLGVLFRHLDRIGEIAGSHRHTAIGSDHDGFVKPALAGLKDSISLADLEAALRERYGDADGAAIASSNFLRLMRGYWRGSQ